MFVALFVAMPVTTVRSVLATMLVTVLAAVGLEGGLVSGVTVRLRAMAVCCRSVGGALPACVVHTAEVLVLVLVPDVVVPMVPVGVRTVVRAESEAAEVLVVVVVPVVLVAMTVPVVLVMELAGENILYLRALHAHGFAHGAHEVDAAGIACE